MQECLRILQRAYQLTLRNQLQAFNAAMQLLQQQIQAATKAHFADLSRLTLNYTAARRCLTSLVQHQTVPEPNCLGLTLHNIGKAQVIKALAALNFASEEISESVIYSASSEAEVHAALDTVRRVDLAKPCCWPCTGPKSTI